MIDETQKNTDYFIGINQEYNKNDFINLHDLHLPELDFNRNDYDLNGIHNNNVSIDNEVTHVLNDLLTTITNTNLWYITIDSNDNIPSLTMDTQVNSSGSMSSMTMSTLIDNEDEDESTGSESYYSSYYYTQSISDSSTITSKAITISPIKISISNSLSINPFDLSNSNNANFDNNDQVGLNYDNDKNFNGDINFTPNVIDNINNNLQDIIINQNEAEIFNIDNNLNLVSPLDINIQENELYPEINEYSNKINDVREQSKNIPTNNELEQRVLSLSNRFKQYLTDNNSKKSVNEPIVSNTYVTESHNIKDTSIANKIKSSDEIVLSNNDINDFLSESIIINDGYPWQTYQHISTKRLVYYNIITNRCQYDIPKAGDINIPDVLNYNQYDSSDQLTNNKTDRNISVFKRYDNNFHLKYQKPDNYDKSKFEGNTLNEQSSKFLSNSYIQDDEKKLFDRLKILSYSTTTSTNNDPFIYRDLTKSIKSGLYMNYTNNELNSKLKLKHDQLIQNEITACSNSLLEALDISLLQSDSHIDKNIDSVIFYDLLFNRKYFIYLPIELTNKPSYYLSPNELLFPTLSSLKSNKFSTPYIQRKVNQWDIYIDKYKSSNYKHFIYKSLADNNIQLHEPFDIKIKRNNQMFTQIGWLDCYNKLPKQIQDIITNNNIQLLSHSTYGIVLYDSESDIYLSTPIDLIYYRNIYNIKNKQNKQNKNNKVNINKESISNIWIDMLTKKIRLAKTLDLSTPQSNQTTLNQSTKTDITFSNDVAMRKNSFIDSNFNIPNDKRFNSLSANDSIDRGYTNQSESNDYSSGYNRASNGNIYITNEALKRSRNDSDDELEFIQLTNTLQKLTNHNINNNSNNLNETFDSLDLSISPDKQLFKALDKSISVSFDNQLLDTNDSNHIDYNEKTRRSTTYPFRQIRRRPSLLNTGDISNLHSHLVNKELDTSLLFVEDIMSNDEHEIFNHFIVSICKHPNKLSNLFQLVIYFLNHSLHNHALVICKYILEISNKYPSDWPVTVIDFMLLNILIFSLSNQVSIKDLTLLLGNYQSSSLILGYVSKLFNKLLYNNISEILYIGSLMLNTRQYNSLYHYSLLLIQSGYLKQAIKYLQRVQVNDNFSYYLRSQLIIGYIYTLLDYKLDMILTNYQTIASFNMSIHRPLDKITLSLAYRGIGLYYYFKSNYNKAISYIQLAIATYPHIYSNYCILGCINVVSLTINTLRNPSNSLSDSVIKIELPKNLPNHKSNHLSNDETINQIDQSFRQSLLFKPDNYICILLYNQFLLLYQTDYQRITNNYEYACKLSKYECVYPVVIYSYYLHYIIGNIDKCKQILLYQYSILQQIERYIVNDINTINKINSHNDNDNEIDSIDESNNDHEKYRDYITYQNKSNNRSISEDNNYILKCINNDYIIIFINLAYAYMDCNEDILAYKYIFKSLELLPSHLKSKSMKTSSFSSTIIPTIIKHPSILRCLGYLNWKYRYSDNKFYESMDYFHNSYRYGNSNIYVLRCYSIVSSYLGNYNQSYECMKQNLAIHPNHPLSNKTFGIMNYIYQPNTTLAITYLIKAIQLTNYQDIESIILLIQIYLENNNYNDCYKLIQHGLLVLPHYPLLWAYLGITLSILGYHTMIDVEIDQNDVNHSSFDVLNKTFDIKFKSVYNLRDCITTIDPEECFYISIRLLKENLIDNHIRSDTKDNNNRNRNIWFNQQIQIDERLISEVYYIYAMFYIHLNTDDDKIKAKQLFYLSIYPGNMIKSINSLNIEHIDRSNDNSYHHLISIYMFAWLIELDGNITLANQYYSYGLYLSTLQIPSYYNSNSSRYGSNIIQVLKFYQSIKESYIYLSSQVQIIQQDIYNIENIKYNSNTFINKKLINGLSTKQYQIEVNNQLKDKMNALSSLQIRLDSHQSLYNEVSKQIDEIISYDRLISSDNNDVSNKKKKESTVNVFNLSNINKLITPKKFFALNMLEWLDRLMDSYIVCDDWISLNEIQSISNNIGVTLTSSNKLDTSLKSENPSNKFNTSIKVNKDTIKTKTNKSVNKDAVFQINQSKK